MSHFKIFIDESWILEHDNSDVMTIGYIKVPEEKYDQIKSDIKSIKLKYGVPQELKWNSCSNSKVNLYIELIKYFFRSSLTFRTVVVKYKQNLDHEQFNQGSHDNFYYKMIYFLLNDAVNPSNGNLTEVFLELRIQGEAKNFKKLTKSLVTILKVILHSHHFSIFDLTNQYLFN